MLNQDQVAEINRNGCLCVEDILSGSEVGELKAELERVIAVGPDGFNGDEPQPVSFRDLNGGQDKPVWQIVNIWEASKAFQRLTYHPLIVKAISQLTGENNLMVWHDQIQYKPAEFGGATTWHQDAPLWPIIKPMTPVSAWIPFDNADEENGCMWMVPGSHKWGNQMEFLRTQSNLKTLEDFKKLPQFQPPADAEIKEVEVISRPVKRGAVSLHHSLTWHGSPFNESTRPRQAVAIHYMTNEARYVAGGDHLMKQFVEMEDGAPMTEAGAHFPVVCKSGEPVTMAG